MKRVLFQPSTYLVTWWYKVTKIVKLLNFSHFFLMVIRADWRGFFHLWQLTDDYDWTYLTQTYPAGQGYKMLRFPSVILGFY